MQFVPFGTPGHSQAYLDAGKSKNAHDALLNGAKILALASWDIINNPSLLKTIQTEFAERRNKAAESDAF